MVLLFRWRRRRLAEERESALSGDFVRAMRATRVPFAAIVGGVVIVFLGLAVLIPVLMQRSLESDDAAPPATAILGAPMSSAELRSALVVFDDSGVTLNGHPIARAEEVPLTTITVIEPVVEALHDLYARRDSFGLHDELLAQVTISPAIPAVRAGSLLASVRKLSPRMHVTVGETNLSFHYLPTSSIPIESFLYVVPRSPSGYSVERQSVSHDPRTHGPPCRERTARRDVASERDLAHALRELCERRVDCIDHVEFSLAQDRSFGDVTPWLATALGLLRFPDMRLLSEGTEPFPDAVPCTDAGTREDVKRTP